MIHKKIYFLLFTFFYVSLSFAQQPNTSKKNGYGFDTTTDIYKAIFKADSTLFHASDNCDSVTVKMVYNILAQIKEL